MEERTIYLFTLSLLMLAMFLITACRQQNNGETDVAASSSRSAIALRGTEGPRLKQLQNDFSIEIEMAGHSFIPGDARVPAGTTVRWINRENTTHAPTGADFAAPKRERGEWFEHTFVQPGTYNYNCRLRPEMEGTITVTS